MNVSRLVRQIAQIALVAMATAVASQGSVAERPISSVSFSDTISDASKVVSRHSDMQVLRISGRSMLPFFGDGSVVIIKKIDAAQLREGMVVVYKNRFGETVAHRVVSGAAAGWVVKGYNNAATDSTLVDGSNLLGVVYATFHSNGNVLPANALAGEVGAPEIALAAPAR